MSKFQNYSNKIGNPELFLNPEDDPSILDLTVERLDRLIAFVDYLKTVEAIDFCITWFQNDYGNDMVGEVPRDCLYDRKYENFIQVYVPNCGTAACIAGHLGIWEQFIKDGGTSNRGFPRLKVTEPSARRFNFSPYGSGEDACSSLELNGIAAFAEYFGMNDHVASVICWGDDNSEMLYGHDESNNVTLQDAIDILQEVIDRNISKQTEVSPNE